jgi:hypothetical protein
MVAQVDYEIMKGTATVEQVFPLLEQCLITFEKIYFPLLTAQKEYEDWLANPPKATTEYLEYSSSDGANIHGDYYAYCTQNKDLPHIHNCFLHILRAATDNNLIHVKT